MANVPSRRMKIPIYYQNDICPLLIEFLNDDNTVWEFQEVEYQVTDSTSNIVISDTTGTVSINIASLPIDERVTATPGEYEVVVRAIRNIDPVTELGCDSIVFNRSGKLTVLEL